MLIEDLLARKGRQVHAIDPDAAIDALCRHAIGALVVRGARFIAPAPDRGRRWRRRG